jgi:NAD(P)H-hydrate epimerase
MQSINKKLIQRLYPKRPAWSYKGSFGKLLIVGGSKTYSGSPALAAMAAIKSGVDLTYIAAPKRSADIISTFSPDLITYPLNGDYFSEKHIPKVLELEKNVDAMVIGGGMERTKKIKHAITMVLKKTNLLCVVDADAIYAVAENKNIINKNFVLTPHSYEFFVLTGKKPPPNIKERSNLVKKFAKKLNCTILLKGYIDLISDGRQVAINKTGCPEMTKGGTGDTLVGICGALLARGTKPFDAACAAAYINGKAGELAAKKYRESLMAENLLNEIHKVIK